MQHPSKPLAKTRQGTLAGSAEQGIHIWRGIPYAAPPVGPLRWRAPQPAARWQGVRPAETFSAASWQDIDYCRELGGGDPGAFSEDCLYLNVWAPASAAQPLPVMVWLHGGGFTIGAGSLPPYDGKALASRDVVVVTVNYRLGHLGFFAHPALEEEAANVSIISRCSIRLPLCSGFRRISTPSAGMPPTSRCLANPPGRAACCR
ncbi:esterase [Klebsiella aerogenes]|nr:esterase [Klebsiella aerogenes]